MRLDVKATAEARARQKRGVKALREIFGSGSKGQMMLEFGKWRSLRDGFRRPIRPQPGCPPFRDAAAKARHLKRKRASAARRRNRR